MSYCGDFSQELRVTGSGDSEFVFLPATLCCRELAAFCYLALGRFIIPTCATFSGPADGVYAVVRQDTKPAIPEPPARPPPPAPSAPATTEAEAEEAPQPPETAPPPAGEEVGEEPPPAPLEQAGDVKQGNSA